MNLISRNLRYIAIMAAAILIGVAAANAFGQEAKEKNKSDYRSKEHNFCSNETGRAIMSHSASCAK